MRPARIVSIVFALLVAAALVVPAALSRADPADGHADLVGTPGPDVLVGTGEADVLRGWKGDDDLTGLDGDDTIYGGRGADVIDGGPGRDTIACGPGLDRVLADTDDVVAADCELMDGGTPGGLPPAPAPPPDSRSVVQVDRQWRCTGAVDLDLVKVTMRVEADAVSLASGCTGRIGRIEIDTWTADGIKVQNASPGAAHELVIEGGYVECHAIAPSSHQDGVQVMGGSRLTMRELTVDCLGNSNFYVNRAGAGATTPTDVVCEGCVFGPRSASTLFIGTSVRSGATNSFVCEGRYFDVRIDGASRPVTSGTVVIPRTDPRCT